MKGQGDYSFGTGSIAAERLVLLADVFQPTMITALALLPLRRWGRVTDVGCGPGSSTLHLDRLLDAELLVGLDASLTFLTAAQLRVPGAGFVAADVTRPLPVVWPDLIYARFVLSHLRDPRSVVRGWADQLAPNGFVVVEEPERIDTDDRTFEQYLDLTSALVASRGATMLVGSNLAALDDARVMENRTVTHAVSRADAATMFGLNLASIRDDPWLRARCSRAELDDLAHALRAAAANPGPTITWQIRQLVLGARPPLEHSGRFS
jgi:trans-aconitate 2-methyltransferase